MLLRARSVLKDTESGVNKITKAITCVFHFYRVSIINEKKEVRSNSRVFEQVNRKNRSVFFFTFSLKIRSNKRPKDKSSYLPNPNPLPVP